VAILAGRRNSVLDNTLSGNRSGLRLSAGSLDNTFSGNSVSASASNGIYLFSATTGYIIGSGRPTGNTFVGNTVTNSTGHAVRMTGADDNSLIGNTFAGTVGTILLENSNQNFVSGNQAPAGTVYVTNGLGTPSTTQVSAQPGIYVQVDATGAFQIQDPNNAVFQLTSGKTVATTVTATSSSVVLNAAVLGTAAIKVSALPLNVAVSGTDPAVVITPTTWVGGTNPTYAWNTTAGSADQDITYTLGGLVAGQTYTVMKNGVLLTQLVADGSGTIVFDDVAGVTTSVGYQITPA